jgi:hypothetical protein
VSATSARNVPSPPRLSTVDDCGAGDYGEAMKGDWVEIVVDAGGDSRTYEVNATRAGRRVEISIVRNVVTVAEVTRGGSVVRTARFMANRVLALVEHPAPRPALPDDLPPGEKG